MLIKIAERLRPYSHVPGDSCLIPGTSYQAQVFPALLRIYDLQQPEPVLIQEISLSIAGPVKDFTLMCDLEKGKMTVWGSSLHGYFRYHLYQTEKGLCFSAEKVSEPGLTINFDNCSLCLKSKDSILLIQNPFPAFSSINLKGLERLSLGNHKAQDWELVKRRLNLIEIFPVWYRLGQMIPKSAFLSTTLLDSLYCCEQVVMSQHPEKIAPVFLAFFQACFQGLLVPRLKDDQYQGILKPNLTESCLSPLLFITKGSELIRKLFVQQQDECISLLPALPPEFHCGRLLQVALDGINMDFEWSKKTIRRIKVRALKDQTVQFHFKKHLKSFRIRRSKSNKGERLTCHTQLVLEKNTDYLFDNFT